MVSFIHAIRTYPLRKAIEVYWQNIMIPLIKINTNEVVSLTDCSQQMDDWEWTWDKDHACHCRSRGGSKTFDFVHYVIFRVLRTGEKWAWLAAKSGQLTQSMLYVQQNPLFKEMYVLTVGNARRHFVELKSGDRILWGIISTSCLGLRMDGIVNDEEEDMQIKQSEEVYPQLEGMMTVSKTGQFLHLGTLWMGTRFVENTEYYPTKIRSWKELYWLKNSPKMKKIMANPKIPEWTKDLLYRCILTAPYGRLFTNIVLGKHGKTADRCGFDYGGEDVCVATYMPNPHQVYLCDEYQGDLEANKGCFDHLRHLIVKEGEGGGYNENDKYGNKAQVLATRIGASIVPVTNQWKSSRQMRARECTLYIDVDRTPLTYADIKNGTFGADGLYLKDAKHPCHYLDAFFHSFGMGFRVWNTKREGNIAYMNS